jgi:hypothetical protein
MKPSRGTSAREMPTLKAIRSRVVMPFSVFFVGNSTEKSRYPGMKRR